MIAGCALSGSGCLAVAVGAAAAGGATAGVLYLRAPVATEFNTDLPNAKAAAELALADLKMPVLGSEQHPGEILIGTRGGDGTAIDITLTAEGLKTRVQIRVGTFGDRDVSEQIMELMAKRLQTPGALPLVPQAVAANNQTPPPPLASGQPAASQIVPASGSQTAPPPLAPAAPQWQR